MKNWKYINGAQVGNADVVKDGNVWVVLYAEGTKSKEFNSEAEAKKFAAQVGNANITPVSKPNAPVKDPKKDDKEKDKDKKPSDPKDKEGYTFKERVKQVTGNSDGTEKLFHSLEKDVEEKEEDNDEKIEEVGNRLDWSENLVGKYVWVKSKGEEWKCYVMQDKGDKVYIRHDSDGSQGWVSKERITGKVNNSKVGNAGYPVLKSKVEELSKEGKSYEEVVKELLKFGFTKADIAQYEGYIREHIGNKKVGNYVVKTIKDFEIDIEKRPGENYWRWYVDHKNGDNLDSGFENSKEEAIRAAERKINSGDFRSPVRNNKTGNSASYDMNEKDYENEYKYLVSKRNNTQKGSKEYEDIQKRLEEIRKKIGRSPFGNSASDDKFAYVMREFDEGKLKTPDGKVVTDPAQAKAIAYSESKKAENGCARARNAMNNTVFTYKGYTIRYRPNTSKYYISSGPNDTYVAKFAYKEYSSEQDAKDAIDGVR